MGFLEKAGQKRASEIMVIMEGFSVLAADSAMEMMPLQPCVCLCHEELRESSSQGRSSVLSVLALLPGPGEVFVLADCQIRFCRQRSGYQRLEVGVC